MKKIVFLSMILLIISCLSAVTWQIALIDSYGDGWNGGKVTVFVNGSAVLTDITLPSGYGPAYHDFTVADGDQITTDYTAGSYGYENEYQIIDHNGTVIATQGASGTPGDITTPIVVSVPAGVPAAASNPTPAHNAIGVALDGNLTWDFGADTDTYDLLFGPAGAMSEVVSNESAVSPGSYSYTGLDGSTVYNWQVVTHNTDSGLSTNGPVWSFTTEVLPISDFPWLADFNTIPFPPLNWSQGMGVLAETTSITSGSMWAYHNFGNTGGSNNAAYINVYGEKKHWLFTPSIDLDTHTSYQLEFDIALTPWTGTAQTALGVNDYIAVVISTDNGATWSESNVLIDWDNTSTISPTGNHHTIDLSSYSGVVKFGFYAQRIPSSTSTDLRFYVDNVQVREIPETPEFSYSPSTMAFSFTQSGTISTAQNVTVSNTGQGNLILTADEVRIEGTDAADFSFDAANLPADLTTGQSVVIPVSFTPQSAGEKSATLVISYESVDYEVALLAYAYAETANLEGFEGSFPPAGWANPGNWSKSTTTYFEGSGSALKSGSSITPYILSTPKLDITSSDGLAFMGRISSTTASLDIIYSIDRTTWTLLESITAPAANTWFGTVVDLSSLEGKGSYYLGFRTMGSSTYYIDNVIMPPFAQEAPGAVTLTSPADAATSQSILPTLSWTPAATGGIPTSYDIYLEANEDIGADPMEFLENVPASPYTLTTPLQYSTTYIWKVVAKNVIGSSLGNTVRSFTTGSAPSTLPLYENWESGDQGEWTIVNGTQVNQWHIGEADPYEGSYSAYISNNGGLTNSYTISSATSVTHLYRDISFDADMMEFPLSFMWKCQGEAVSYDRMRVYLVDTSVTPLVGTELSTGQIGLTNYNVTPSWTEANIILPGTLSGSVKRLVFSWRNDSGGGSNPPINIDNISLDKTPYPVNPIFTIDPTSWNYNQVQLGQSGTKAFTITNSGGGTLFIDKDEVTLTGDDAAEFNLTPIAEDISLAPGQSTQITVDFVPSSEGPKSATLQIIDNTTAGKATMKSGARVTRTVALTGEGFDATISSFPWTESFEAATFPPTGWTTADLDGGGAFWESSTSFNHTVAGSRSAKHGFSSAIPIPGQNGWLITPPIVLPAATNMAISFWNYNQYPNDLVYNGVLVNTTADPNDPNWEEIWAADTATASWTNEIVSITGYAGQSIYLAFVYQGYNADSWFVDDIEIYQPFDYPEDQPITIGEGDDAITITVTGGSANNVPGGVIPDIPNGAFVYAGSFVLELISAGPWTVTIETDAPWGAYYRNGNWTAVENADGFIVFVIEASKDLTLPIILGDVDPTLPVTLASFTAVLTSDLHVNIAWMAESEVDHAGYNLLRSEVKELATALRLNALMIDEGTANGTQMSYLYTDKEVYHNALYYYWLESVSLSGESQYHGPIMVLINANGEEPGIPEIPIETKLFSAFPNPFNPSTNLRYSMKEAGNVRIDVYNVKGQILKTFENNHSLPGYYQVSWDGRDMNGRVVGTGVYFYRMSSGKYSATKKMVLAK